MNNKEYPIVYVLMSVNWETAHPIAVYSSLEEAEKELQANLDWEASRKNTKTLGGWEIEEAVYFG